MNILAKTGYSLILLAVVTALWVWTGTELTYGLAGALSAMGGLCLIIYAIVDISRDIRTKNRNSETR